MPLVFRQLWCITHRRLGRHGFFGRFATSAGPRNGSPRAQCWPKWRTGWISRWHQVSRKPCAGNSDYQVERIRSREAYRGWSFGIIWLHSDCISFLCAKVQLLSKPNWGFCKCGGGMWNIKEETELTRVCGFHRLGQSKEFTPNTLHQLSMESLFSQADATRVELAGFFVVVATVFVHCSVRLHVLDSWG